jgi:hypothetical protein
MAAQAVPSPLPSPHWPYHKADKQCENHTVCTSHGLPTLRGPEVTRPKPPKPSTRESKVKGVPNTKPLPVFRTPTQVCATHTRSSTSSLITFIAASTISVALGCIFPTKPLPTHSMSICRLKLLPPWYHARFRVKGLWFRV